MKTIEDESTNANPALLRRGNLAANANDNRRCRIRSGVAAVALFLAVVASARADLSSADEMAEAQRFAAAKFRQTILEPEIAPGLHVLTAYGPVTLNCHGERPLILGSKVYKRGFYCHANSRILVRLPGPGKSLTAMFGINSNDMTAGGRGSIVCAVQVEGKDAFRSGVLHEGMAPQPVLAELNGVREFILEVNDAGDGNSCDQSAWVDVLVTLADGERLWLGEMALFSDRPRSYSIDPPFSFEYGGKPSAELLKTWPRKNKQEDIDAVRIHHTINYADPGSALQVRCEAVEYRDFPTVEWTLYFKNAGSADTPILADIQALDDRFESGGEGQFVLYHHTGDNCTPDSYAPHRLVLEPGREQRFAPNGGRPTTGAFPYFNVQLPGGGVIAVIGWPGQWETKFKPDTTGLRIVGGQQRTRLVLHPGEEIRTPRIVLQFWRQDRVRAQNVWRRWMIAHNMPRPEGKTPAPIFDSCSGGFFPGLMCNEADERRFIDTYAKQGIKLTHWWMDAGWYPCGPGGWPKVGTWEPDPTRFPNGIKAVSDYAHSQGLKLILWFEPERVAAGTWLTMNHPEWILGGANGGLLNLGDAQARGWLVEHIDKLLNEQGIDLYRQDFNIDPLEYWRGHDAPDRQGMTEIRHIEGYLAYWDELRRRHPGMLIDSCASGGRRNDIETLRRAVPLLRSDYQSFAGDPAYALGNQGHTYGIATWIPYFGQGVYYNKRQLAYAVRSHFCPAFGFCWDVRKEGVDWNVFRRLSEDWRSIADDFLGDYYPLTPYSLDETLWIAWQFNRPETGTGFVQAFRRNDSIYASAQLPLAGLNPEARYRLTNRDTQDEVVLSGRELMDQGLRVAIPEKPGAVIITYRALEN
ncbi:MAG: alpha-galactosidase [Candidatus Omnitrophica bacterium]|nr:alpha-galactosidase [Candidatus Omnitrophota bacterium]